VCQKRKAAKSKAYKEAQLYMLNGIDGFQISKLCLNVECRFQDTLGRGSGSITRSGC